MSSSELASSELGVSDAKMKKKCCNCKFCQEFLLPKSKTSII